MVKDNIENLYTDDIKDQIFIKRVANGWVIYPGNSYSKTNEFTHIANTPEELAEHIRLWAQLQPKIKVK